MSNTKRTSGPTPNIVRQGHTASSVFGQDPTSKATGPVGAKPRDLKP